MHESQFQLWCVTDRLFTGQADPFVHDIQTMTNDRQTYVQSRDIALQADLCA